MAALGRISRATTCNLWKYSLFKQINTKKVIGGQQGLFLQYFNIFFVRGSSVLSSFRLEFCPKFVSPSGMTFLADEFLGVCTKYLVNHNFVSICYCLYER